FCIWGGALRKRAELDNLPELGVFADKLEGATIKTIEDGIMPSDLARIAEPPPQKIAYTEEFLDEIAKRLEER
ncbi:unnamed protein product, partial [marine sediment metagenome]